MEISTKHIAALLAIAITLFSSCKKEDFGEERNNLENTNNQDALNNPLSEDSPCNGHPELCNKRYDNVLFPVSYNSYNNLEDGGIYSAQEYSLRKQLENGVRGLQLNVFLSKNTNLLSVSSNDLYLRDSLNSIEQWELVPALKEVKVFLDRYPNEILTLFIENFSSTALLNDAFVNAGLEHLLYEHPIGEPWPVLGRMVYEDKRLVVFTSQNNDSFFPWNHPMNSFIEHGKRNYNNISEMNCSGNIEDLEKPFFMVHHYISLNNNNGFNTQYSTYEQINSTSFILEQLLECTDVKQSNPNFIVLKNIQTGNFQDAVDAINGI